MTNDALVHQALIDLDSDDPVQRIDALHRLRPHKDSQIAPKVIPLLHDPNPAIRRLAAQVLSRNGDAGVVEALINALYDDDIDVREATADALGALGDHKAVDALIDALYDDEINVRFAATEALGLIGDSRSMVDLIRILDSDDVALATMAAMALHKLGTPEALAAIQHLWDGDHYVFEDIPGNTDITLPHIPIPKFEDEPSQSQNQEAEETIRHIPRDRFQEFLDSDDLTEPEVERGIPSAEPATPPAEPVQFSAYYPRELTPNVWQPLRAYVMKLSAADAVAADARQQLGDQFSEYRQVERPAGINIAEGALITATPILDGFQFNPPSAQAAFYDAFERFDFKLRAMTAPLDQASNGRITFTVEGVIVADIPLSIYVANSIPAPSTVTPSPVTRPVYQAIFCSYSRQDTQIIEHVERAYKVLGLDFLRDVESLKSGQDWSEELLQLIERADIFQLFWSNASAQSAAVRKEWIFALSLNRPGAFIRPVYWQQPMPPVPPELGPINFAYAPDLGK